MSQLGWIDFSSDERDKVKQVLAALNEPGTLDELGIGQIRDAFANRLFPGLSTIQTRAKYFITVARMLRDIQTGKVKNAQSAQLWLEQQEHKLARQLVDAVSRHDDSKELGIIGAESIQQGGVSRRPSSIYWNGLKTFGIVHTSLSLREFCSQLADNQHVPHSSNHKHQEGADDDDVDRLLRLIDLPNANEHWQSDPQLSINLTPDEATFFRDKIMTTSSIEHSVPAQILRAGGMAALLLRANDKDEEAVALDALGFDAMVALLLNHQKVSERCKHELKQAQAFSFAMEGPHICYNRLLANSNGFQALAGRLAGEFADWQERANRLGVFYPSCVDHWFEPILESGIHPKSQAFVEGWCALMLQGASIGQLESHVDSRARFNKGPRCLLSKKRDSEQWVGIRRLEYRWATARRLLGDIQAGLAGGSDA